MRTHAPHVIHHDATQPCPPASVASFLAGSGLRGAIPLRSSARYAGDAGLKAPTGRSAHAHVLQRTLPRMKVAQAAGNADLQVRTRPGGPQPSSALGPDGGPEAVAPCSKYMFARRRRAVPTWRSAFSAVPVIRWDCIFIATGPRHSRRSRDFPHRQSAQIGDRDGAVREHGEPGLGARRIKRLPAGERQVRDRFEVRGAHRVVAER